MVNKTTTQTRIEPDNTELTPHGGINMTHDPIKGTKDTHRSTNTEATSTEDKRLNLTTEDGKLNLECQNTESLTPHAHRILARNI